MVRKNVRLFNKQKTKIITLSARLWFLEIEEALSETTFHNENFFKNFKLLTVALHLVMKRFVSEKGKHLHEISSNC